MIHTSWKFAKLKPVRLLYMDKSQVMYIKFINCYLKLNDDYPLDVLNDRVKILYSDIINSKFYTDYECLSIVKQFLYVLIQITIK